MNGFGFLENVLKLLRSFVFGLRVEIGLGIVQILDIGLCIVIDGIGNDCDFFCNF